MHKPAKMAAHGRAGASLSGLEKGRRQARSLEKADQQSRHYKIPFPFSMSMLGHLCKGPSIQHSSLMQIFTDPGIQILL